MSQVEDLAAGTPYIIRQLFYPDKEIGELCNLLESAHTVATKSNVEGCGKFTCPYGAPKKSGSSNVVQTWIYSDDTPCTHSYAVRIGKKDITVYDENNEKDNKLKKLWNFYWKLNEETKTKVREDLRQHLYNRGKFSSTRRCNLGKTLNCPVYTNNSSVCFDALRKLVTFAQSYDNWTKLSESYVGPQVWGFQFIKDQGETHLCIIMGEGYSDLQSFFKHPDFDLKFKPEKIVEKEIGNIYREREVAKHKQQQTSTDFAVPQWEYYEGESEVHSGKQTLTTSDVLIAHRIMEQFDEMHAGGILCFDIKPGNLIIIPKYLNSDPRTKIIVNWIIYIIDLDADWCDNIVFDSVTPRGRERELKTKQQMVKVFLANQFFKHVGKNIFCQWFVNMAYISPKNFEGAVKDELCSGGATSDIWKKMVSHYLPKQVKCAWQRATGATNRKVSSEEKELICVELYDRMLLNCYYINQKSMDADNPKNLQTPDGQNQIKSPFGLKKFVKGVKEGICRFFGLGKSGGRKTKKRRRKKTKKRKKGRNSKTNRKRKSRKRRKRRKKI